MQNKIIICGGFNNPIDNNNFTLYLPEYFENILVFPTNKYPPYDGLKILNFLQEKNIYPHIHQLIFIAFSAGVVGAIAAGRLWQRKRGVIKSLLAVDGWGVPLIANFPIHCISHDIFTHHTSIFWVTNPQHFYAQPRVSHHHMWRSPVAVNGYYENYHKPVQNIKEIEFIKLILNQYL